MTVNTEKSSQLFLSSGVSITNLLECKRQDLYIHALTIEILQKTQKSIVLTTYVSILYE